MRSGESHLVSFDALHIDFTFIWLRRCPKPPGRFTEGPYNSRAGEISWLANKSSHLNFEKKKSRLRRRLQKLCCNFKKYKWNNPQTTRWPQNVAVRNKTACLYFWHQEKLKSRRKTMRPEYKSTCFCTLLEIKERLCWVDFKGAFHNKRTILTLIPRQSLGGGEAGLPTWERWTFQ